MKVETVDINKLKPFERNPKKHPESQLKKLEKSISEFGWTNPILATKDGMVVAGHARLEVAKRLNIGNVPVIYLDMPYEKAIAYVIADNRLAELAETDTVQLSELLGELQALPDFDIELTGFDLDEVASLCTTDVVEDDFDVGSALDDVDEPVTQRGDLILLGMHRLYCGDSTDAGDVEMLMDGNKADMVFCDPPYGIDYSGGRTQVVAKKEYGKIKGDHDEDISRFIKAILNVAGNKDYYICLSPMNLKNTLNQIPKYDGIIIWKKPQPGLGYQWVRRYCEFIIFNTERKKKKSESSMFDFWDMPTDPKKDYRHGTQKPIMLSSKAIIFSSVVNDVVVDLFLGSGSTLIACEQTNRICYGMELDEKYCDVIVSRWEDFTSQKAIRPKT